MSNAGKTVALSWVLGMGLLFALAGCGDDSGGGGVANGCAVSCMQGECEGTTISDCESLCRQVVRAFGADCEQAYTALGVCGEGQTCDTLRMACDAEITAAAECSQ